MKSLITISILLFTVTFSSPSYAKWVKVAMNARGETFYIDLERIKKRGYIYVWSLLDRQKPNHVGYLSTLTYQQIDCKAFRFKILKYSFNEEEMGSGRGNSTETQKPKWELPSPLSYGELVLKRICGSRAGY